MPILIALTVIIQACFVIHALRTGRPYYWVFIIVGSTRPWLRRLLLC